MIVREGDLKAPESELLNVLDGIDVVVCSVGPADQQDQIALAKAAKKAGVKRFVPCGFITIAPPGGIMWLRDQVRKDTCHGHFAVWCTNGAFRCLERGCVQRHQAAVAAIHNHRRWLVVPARVPQTAIGKD